MNDINNRFYLYGDQMKHIGFMNVRKYGRELFLSRDPSSRLRKDLRYYLNSGDVKENYQAVINNRKLLHEKSNTIKKLHDDTHTTVPDDRHRKPVVDLCSDIKKIQNRNNSQRNSTLPTTESNSSESLSVSRDRKCNSSSSDSSCESQTKTASYLRDSNDASESLKSEKCLPANMNDREKLIRIQIERNIEKLKKLNVPPDIINKFRDSMEENYGNSGNGSSTTPLMYLEVNDYDKDELVNECLLANNYPVKKLNSIYNSNKMKTENENKPTVHVKYNNFYVVSRPKNEIKRRNSEDYIYHNILLTLCKSCGNEGKSYIPKKYLNDLNDEGFIQTKKIDVEDDNLGKNLDLFNRMAYLIIPKKISDSLLNHSIEAIVLKAISLKKYNNFDVLDTHNLLTCTILDELVNLCAEDVVIRVRIVI